MCDVMHEVNIEVMHEVMCKVMHKANIKVMYEVMLEVMHEANIEVMCEVIFTCATPQTLLYWSVFQSETQ